MCSTDGRRPNPLSQADETLYGFPPSMSASTLPLLTAALRFAAEQPSVLPPLVMPLFTFFLDYDGGTYAAQVEAASWREAPEKWAQQISPQVLAELGAGGHDDLCKQVVSSVPVALDQLESAWCMSASVNEKLALINYVRTARQSAAEPP